MTIEKFTLTLSRLFPQSTKAGFSPETEFKKCVEWNSLLALSLISLVEDEFDVVLKSKDILNAQTVRDLFNATVAKKNYGVR
ncbi:MAG: phosphopantetheine-binding protein [Bacteroidales bacterium]|nr:phosphopantetheine-binding protein [Bacteroidales bacterium]